MMTKTFTVSDDTQITVAYSAYTPLLYRELFPDHEYFADVQACVTGENVMEPYYRFAYVGAYMAADGHTADFHEWLDQFNLVDFIAVLNDVWTFMNQNNRTTSKSKKK